MRGWRISDIERLQNKGMVAGTPQTVTRETKSKYGNKKTNGFASKKESDRYQELRLMEHAGLISELETQKKFEIRINNQVVCSYVCDFQYKENGQIKVEDAKGFPTPVYRLKKKLMKACLNIDIIET